MKNLEKIFGFWEKSVWSWYRNFCVVRYEYLASEVNVLANSLKIYHQSKEVFIQLNLPEIHGKNG